MGKQWKQWQTLFWGLQNDCNHEIKRHLLLGRKVINNLHSILKSRDIILPTKVHLVKAVVFPVVMYGCDSWIIKKIENQCFRTVMLEKTFESPLDWKEIQSAYPKGNQSWIFTGKTDDEAEAPIFWPPDAKNWFIRKDPDAGKDLRQEEKGTIENEMVGWQHRLNGHEYDQTSGVGDGQGCLACCSPWGLKESDTTERLNWTELNMQYTKNPLKLLVIYLKLKFALCLCPLLFLTPLEITCGRLLSTFHVPGTTRYFNYIGHHSKNGWK